LNISIELLAWLLCNSEDFETAIRKTLEELEKPRKEK
jgi:hypothetical protein